MNNISIGVDEVGRGSLAGPVFAVASTLVDTNFNPISSHLGPTYHFLTTREVISGQKYYKNTQKLKEEMYVNRE